MILTVAFRGDLVRSFVVSFVNYCLGGVTILGRPGAFAFFVTGHIPTYSEKPWVCAGWAEVRGLQGLTGHSNFVNGIIEKCYYYYEILYNIITLTNRR